MKIPASVRALLALAAGCSFVLLAAGTAHAAAPAPADGTDVVDGQAVTVTGTARGASEVRIYECARTAPGDPHLDPRECDPGNVVRVTPAADGSYAARYVVHDPFVRADGHEVDCSTATCEVVTDDPHADHDQQPDHVIGSVHVIGAGCRRVFDAPTSSSVAISTSAGPGGSIVSAGSTLTVELTWDPATSASAVVDCVRVDGRVDPALSHTSTPAPGQASVELSVVVPDRAGAQLCVRGALAAARGGVARTDGVASAQGGEGADRAATATSPVVCYTIAGAPVLPEAPAAALLPVSAVVVSGGALVVMRRRRRPAA